jgi:tetratricopeptide (TPR) repeat protein
MEYFNKAVGQTIQFPEVQLIFARYYNIKGASKADDGQLREALEYFNKAIELNPRYSVALFNRATIKADLGDLRGAKKDFSLAKNIEAETDYETVPFLSNSLKDEISSDKINFF